MRHIAAFALAVSAMACTSALPSPAVVSRTAQPSISTSETALASSDPSARPSERPAGSPQICRDLFTPPPFEDLRPVPGISVRAIDQGHFEITNATDRTYYLGVSRWVTQDNLVCGRGVIDHSTTIGGIRPGATVEWSGGSSPESPTTVSVWDSPCGEGCVRPPIGAYVVPLSRVVPVPIAS